MPTNLLKCVVLGVPGSGRHIVQRRMKQYFGMIDLASKEILTEAITKNYPCGPDIQKLMSLNLLIPDEIVIKLVLESLDKYKEQSLSIRGFPRHLVQAEELSKVQNIAVAINIIVPFDNIIERLRGEYVHPASGRRYHPVYLPPMEPNKDDVTGEPLVKSKTPNLERVFAHLRSHEENMEPIIDYYKEAGVLHEFKGRTVNDIWPKVMNHIEKFVPYLPGVKEKREQK